MSTEEAEAAVEKIEVRGGKIWVDSDGVIYPTTPAKPTEVKPGIYQVKYSPAVGIYMQFVSSKFDMPNKIYGHDKSFIDRVVKTYTASNKNIGVLLNGVKGAGKTFTAKSICNMVNLPVILISEYMDHLPIFINHINFPCVILIDEYDKIFGNENRGILLTCMDGTHAPQAKVMFLLTTNNLYINENMINRPSRIKYLRTYSDLAKPVILEIIEDMLEDKTKKPDLLKGLARLNLITTDLLIEIIREVNLHGDNIQDFISYFNCNREQDYSDGNRSYREYRITDVKASKVLYEKVSIRGFVENVFSRWATDDDYNEFLLPISKVSEDTIVCKIMNPEYKEWLNRVDNDDEETDDNDENKRVAAKNEKRPEQYIECVIKMDRTDKPAAWQFSHHAM